MYSVASYGKMISDEVRLEAYVAALRKTVRPGCVVVDVGTGTGIFALLACQFGARRVIAIDTSDAVVVGRELAQANGFADRIEFHQASSLEVTPSEPADVLIGDLRGSLPLYKDQIAVMADARRRMLKPLGAVIPQRDTLWASVVSDAELYGEQTSAWRAGLQGLDLSRARRFAVNDPVAARSTPEKQLSDAVCFWTVDYEHGSPSDVAARFSLTVRGPAEAHGLLVWFDTELADGIGFSCAPGKPEVKSYQPRFFPWQEPVAVQAGDRVEVEFLVSGTGDVQLWQWNCRVVAPDAGTTKADFRQSDFLSNPISPGSLRRRQADHMPGLALEGEVDRFILEQMDGSTTLAEIATRSTARFADRFKHWEQALTRAADLSVRYGKSLP